MAEEIKQEEDGEGKQGLDINFYYPEGHIEKPLADSEIPRKHAKFQ